MNLFQIKVIKMFSQLFLQSVMMRTRITIQPMTRIAMKSAMILKNQIQMKKVSDYIKSELIITAQNGSELMRMDQN